jgi:hypothetical protein
MPFVGIGVGVGRQRFASGGGGFVGLLDEYSGAAAAYSLRQLSSTYTGDAIRVRRASDSTEQDIGFVNNELDTATLESFCSGSDGFVTKWYDQSGSSNDAGQTTAVRQPKIVSSGSLILDNGNPSILLDGTNDYFSFTDTAYNNYSIYGVYSNANFTSFQVLVGKFLSDYLRIDSGGASIFTNPGGVKNGYGGVINTQTLLTLNRDTSNNIISYKNNTIFGTTYNNSASLDLLFIGQANDIWWWNGKISEIVMYQSDKTSDVSGINTNINSYYGIY